MEEQLKRRPTLEAFIGANAEPTSLTRLKHGLTQQRLPA